MDDLICLDKSFSTTRCLSKQKPLNSEEETDSTISTLDNSYVIGEGGLRTKGYFKNSHKDKPLISIITVVYNAEKYLEETINSILNQTYDNIEFIVIDGASTDSSLEIIKKYEDQIDYWVSEPDKGMYDAIKKGFNLSRGEILSWLNADDIYYKGTTEIVASIFNKTNINWLTGIASHIDENGIITNVSLPKTYFRFLIEKGYYRDDILGFIQQESTFFRKELFKKIEFNSNLQLAADYDLWIKLSKYSELYTIKTILASFRIHEGQKSGQIEKYYKECDLISKPKKFKFIKFFLYLSIFLKIRLISPRKYLKKS